MAQKFLNLGLKTKRRRTPGITPLKESNPMTKQPQTKVLMIGALALAVAIIGYLLLNAPDRRTPGEKIGNAIDALPNGADKAARQLEDRTPGQKLKDAVKDAGHD
jgi:hypothetical protein